MLLILRVPVPGPGPLWSHVPYPTRVPPVILSPQPTHMVIVITGPGA